MNDEFAKAEFIMCFVFAISYSATQQIRSTDLPPNTKHQTPKTKH